jgi:hypothetical protein
MFDFAEKVNVTKTGQGFVMGELTTRPSFNKQSKEGAIAVSAESVEAFMRMVQTEMPEPKNAGSSNRVKSSWDSDEWSFNTFRTYAETLDTYQNHPEKVRSFKPLDKDIKVPQATGNETFYDVEGDWLDIDRYLEGGPEVFGQGINGNPNNLFATIVINLSAVCDYDEATMRRRGERLVRLVDWLEGQRIRTQIKAFSANQCGHIEITVKKHEDAFDIDALAIVTHPDFFRRLVFRVKEYSKTWSYGYGTATMIHNGYMTLPEQNGNGILLWTENHKEASKTDKIYDEAETNIERMLEDGETTFSMIL